MECEVWGLGRDPITIPLRKAGSTVGSSKYDMSVVDRSSGICGGSSSMSVSFSHEISPKKGWCFTSAAPSVRQPILVKGSHASSRLMRSHIADDSRDGR